MVLVTAPLLPDQTAELGKAQCLVHLRRTGGLAVGRSPVRLPLRGRLVVGRPAAPRTSCRVRWWLVLVMVVSVVVVGNRALGKPHHRRAACRARFPRLLEGDPPAPWEVMLSPGGAFCRCPGLRMQPGGSNVLCGGPRAPRAKIGGVRVQVHLVVAGCCRHPLAWIPQRVVELGHPVVAPGRSHSVWSCAGGDRKSGQFAC